MDYSYYDEGYDIDYTEFGEDAGDDIDYGFYSGHKQDNLYSDAKPEARDFLVMDRLLQNIEACVQPSLLQVAKYVTPMLGLCLVGRLLCLLYARKRRLPPAGVSQRDANSIIVAPLHLIHATTGLILLYATLGQRLGERVGLLLILSALGYLMLQLVRVYSGRRAATSIAVLTVGSQFLYELAIWRQRSDWPQLRGVQMVVNMKLISLGFDLASGQVPRMPGPLAYLGYIYSPATCALGPWISYGRYVECLVARGKWLTTLRQLVLNMLLCLLAVAVSNCLAHALGEIASGSHLLLMYTEALGVRSSHYFVSFMAQALLVSSGQTLDGESKDSKELDERILGPLVARPWQIEWPRSLSVLVRSWNIPMHEWLKHYIYGGFKEHNLGHTFWAVLCTYVVSSLLHGMDLRIYMVLLFLAIFAESERLLRRHLAKLFDACLAAGQCKGPDHCCFSRCPRRRGWTDSWGWLVRLTNLIFTLVAMFHLAYLGIVLLNETLNLDGSPAGELESFVWHWSEAGYLSHYIGFGMFLLYLFIS
ncbi:protein-serine O-palmitoleoyltransferase porcupine [Drosophila pseudoobscura]|uniref:Protein-serine O-palmitoleoyltransferase porcupine n=1 Tax=Drosophila pseudoobscura pseudoobscura TaxID=46245 RepID=Q29G23_DROPS|nr:protein-serine O-palmitoleoyltransferase porcupine [Drosophila pseudoobscura]